MRAVPYFHRAECFFQGRLIKLFGVPVFADKGTRDGSRFGEQRIQFRSTFNRARFDAARAFADALLRDDDKERSGFGAGVLLICLFAYLGTIDEGITSAMSR